VEVEVVA
jgi:hypothetical protein